MATAENERKSQELVDQSLFPLLSDVTGIWYNRDFDLVPSSPLYQVSTVHSDASYPGTSGPGTARISGLPVSQDNSRKIQLYML